MKTPFFKTLTFSCYILILSAFVISCEDNNEVIPDQINSTKSLKLAARNITSPNATVMNQNNRNHSADVIDSFDCFDFVFPPEVVNGTQNSTINNEDELEDYLDALGDNEDPVFVYPLSIELEDGSIQTIQNDTELEDAFVDCFEDDEDCFTINFPVTVTDGNGNNTEVNNEDELYNFYDSLSDNDEPTFIYPITVTMLEDNSVVTINDDEEFDTLYEDCYDFEDCDDFEDFDCFSIKYPITATSSAGGEITVNSDDELEGYFDTLGDDEDPQFTFPITIIFDDNSEKIINSLEELEDEFDECFDDVIEIDDCFNFEYAITLVKEDGTKVSVNSDDEFDTFIDGLSDDEEFNFEYPFNIKLINGTIQTINNEDEFYDLFDNCD